VVITGHGDVPMAVDSMKKGAMDFIQKPFNEEELVTLVERMLEHARGAFASTSSRPAATRCCPSSPAARRRCSSASSPAA
jgi:FixJ family two-component response regulator